jgi:hypothetical protein
MADTSSTGSFFADDYDPPPTQAVGDIMRQSQAVADAVAAKRKRPGVSDLAAPFVGALVANLLNGFMFSVGAVLALRLLRVL